MQFTVYFEKHQQGYLSLCCISINTSYYACTCIHNLMTNRNQESETFFINTVTNFWGDNLIIMHVLKTTKGN